jgi:hypothetical protein
MKENGPQVTAQPIAAPAPAICLSPFRAPPMGIGLEPRQERRPGLLKRATSPPTTAGRTFSEDSVVAELT